MPTLKVDDREDAWVEVTLREAMSHEKDWEVVVQRLDVGDVCFGDVLGIERKTPNDFLGSFGSNRLQQQCKELKDNFEVAVLMVTGNIDDVVLNPYRKFHPWSITAMIGSLVMKYKVVPLFVGDRAFPFMTRALAVKGAETPEVDYTPVRRAATIGEQREAILASFPGVGPTRAKAILAKYGTLQEALANVHLWAKEVEGLGSVTVEKIQRVLVTPG